MIRERYLPIRSTVISRSDSAYFCPMLVVNGVPLAITEDLNEKLRNDLTTLLHDASISDIAVLDTQANVIFCRPFSGAILIVAKDKTVQKKLRRLKI